MGRSDFKSGEGRQASLVGSTPTLFRHDCLEARLKACTGPRACPILRSMFARNNGAAARATPVARDLVLLGGGHSHVAVLRRFGMRPQAGTRLTLVSRDADTPYTGMLPGVLAGRYDHAASHIDLRKLCRFAQARLYHAGATGLDLEGRLVHCDGRPPVPFDVLSIDIGSVPSSAGIAGAERAIPVRPVETFLARWRGVEEALLAGEGVFRVVVIGGGAGGAEVAFSLQYRLHELLRDQGRDPDRLSVAIVSRSPQFLDSHGAAARRRVQGLVEARGIDLHLAHNVVAVEEGRLVCDSAADMPFDAAALVTHAAAPPWLRATGLDLDDAGFIRVRDTLESTSHPRVFAAGNVASIADRALAKSGVYAVRQGPVLARSLRRTLENRPPVRFKPQRRTLALISSGYPYAVASYGPIAFGGRWVWEAKNWIDRRWMGRYQKLPKMGEQAAGNGALEDASMRCGGCGAKVASAVLRRTLQRLDPIARDGVLAGIEAADDAAIVAAPPGKVLVQTVDHFRAFIDDPFLFGQVTANHCLGDIYAMGAEPHSALAFISLPFAPEAKIEHDLHQVLSGAVETLNEAGAALIGGHTSESVELSFGLSINGFADEARLLRKRGARPGDALILTKALGTGTIFAADMRAEASSRSVEGALASMLSSNKAAAECVVAHGATACTDVTGFGLLGHLLEVLRASAADAALDLDRLPVLDGARELMAAGIASSLQPVNEAFAASLRLDVRGAETHPSYPLLFDPQTAGGLLASVPSNRAAACVAALRAAGCARADIIGRVTERTGAEAEVALRPAA